MDEVKVEMKQLFDAGDKQAAVVKMRHLKDLDAELKGLM